jgi:hypothetical protein
MRTHKRTSFVNCQPAESYHATFVCANYPVVVEKEQNKTEKTKKERRKVVLTLKVSIWTRLQTNCQVDYVVVGGRTIEA